MENGSSLDQPEAETFTEIHRNGGCLVEGRVDSAVQNLGYVNSLPIDLEKEFQNLFCSNLKDKDDDFVPLESSNIIKHIDLVNHKSDGYLSDTKNRNNKCDGVQNVNGDGNGGDDEKLGTGVKDDITASCAETEKEFNSRKRKRESPVAQPLTEPSKGKEYKGGQDISVQMLRARDVLSVRKHAEPNYGSSSKVYFHYT
jgi:hypothetical protein